MTSYMIALIPPQDMIMTCTQAAQKLFSSVSDDYLLSEHSLPHITVCQFECEQKQIAQAVWKEVASQITTHSVPVQLRGISFIKGLEAHRGFYWAELAVARDEELMKMHRLAVVVTQARGLTCLNEIGDLYRPHLTLARIRLPKSLQTWPDDLLDSPAPFKLDFMLCSPYNEEKKK